MHCCLWFRSVFRVQGPWPKRYGYHLSIIIIIIIIIIKIFNSFMRHTCESARIQTIDASNPST